MNIFLNLHVGFSSLFVFLFMVLCSDFIEEMSFWSLLETQIRNVLKISPSLVEGVFHRKIFSLSPQSGRFIWTVLSIPLPAIFCCVLIITRQCDVCPEPVLRSQYWIIPTQGKGKGRKDRFRFTKVLLCKFSSLGRKGANQNEMALQKPHLSAFVSSLSFGGHLVFSGKCPCSLPTTGQGSLVSLTWACSPQEVSSGG